MWFRHELLIYQQNSFRIKVHLNEKTVVLKFEISIFIGISVIMRKLFLITILLLSMHSAYTQKWYWDIHALGFADNREYKSTVQTDQTLYGMHISPQVYVKFDTLHALHFGFNGLQEFGSTNEKFALTPYMYYDFAGNQFDFSFGVFPRAGKLDQTPNVLYYDSLNYFRPYVSGLYWTYNYKGGNQSVYLDWTGRQTDTQRETFIMGWQGKVDMGALFIKNYFYIYHYAFPAVRPEGSYMRDNGVGLITLGIDFSKYIPIDSLSAGVSYVQSFERDRIDGKAWEMPKGVMADIYIGYKGFFIGNTFYYGQGHRLDWGDPFYRLPIYNRTDMGYSLLNYKRVRGSFIYSIHYGEKKVSHQQQFLLSVDIGSKF